MAAGVVLDVNETLFSLESLDPIFEDLGLAGGRDVWFARTLRNGFALTAMGEYRTFPDVARGALMSLAPDRLTSADADDLLAAFATLEPHPDVVEGLRILRASGMASVTLTVGNAATVRGLFDQSGISDLVDGHLSCEEVSRWKPAPEPYRHACSKLGLAPHSVWMVAAHAWDLAGARSVGMQTAWLSRLEGAVDPNFGEPDVAGFDLTEVVAHIVSR